MKFVQTKENVSLISCAKKLVDDSTYLTKTLEVADAFLDNLVKIYDRKSIIFMQYGTEWLICKFNITKPYFEKFINNGGAQNFHKFVCDEILYPDPTKLLPAFFHSRVRIRQTIFGRVSRKYQKTLLGSVSMFFLARNNGVLNIFITPKLCRDAKESFVKNLTEIGLCRVPYNLLQVFRH